MNKFYTVKQAEKEWEKIINSKGKLSKEKIYQLMTCFNMDEKEKMRSKNNDYISHRNDWSFSVKGDDLQDLYYQHFPIDEGAVYV